MQTYSPQEVPCFVEFEMRDEEDRTASIERGQAVYKNVIFAIITPPGGHLVVEKEAATWLEERKRDRDIFSDHYHKCYDAFMDGIEAPIEGTAIENWPPATPAQVKAIRGANVRTIEALAAANDDTLRRMGMGAQSLKQRAQAWLESASETGQAAEQLAALKADVERLTANVARLEEDKAILSKKMNEAEVKRGRGRPRKVAYG